MASRSEVFNDSSGRGPDKGMQITSKTNKVIPEALNLQQQECSTMFRGHRDSGCFSASPFSANMASSASLSTGSSTPSFSTAKFHFPCPHSPSCVSTPLKTPDSHEGAMSSRVAASCEGSNSLYSCAVSTVSEYSSVTVRARQSDQITRRNREVDSLLFPDDFESNEIDDVSEQEDQKFADSGIHELMASCHLTSPLTTSTTTTYITGAGCEASGTMTSQPRRVLAGDYAHPIGKSTFYLPSCSAVTSHSLTYQSYRSTAAEESSTDHEEDDDSSTTQEFCVADNELPEGSPSSSPINIPPRSNSSSPPADDVFDEADGISFSCPVGSSDGGSSCSPVVSRMTAAQMAVRRRQLNYARPSSGTARMEGNSRQQQYYSVSIDGAAGPLPDLVQSSLRYRAYSESAIYATQMTERVGASLRNMCDEFTLDHTRRRDNINLLNRLQRRYSNLGPMTQSQTDATTAQSPKAESILSKLLHKKL